MKEENKVNQPTPGHAGMKMIVLRELGLLNTTSKGKYHCNKDSDMLLFIIFIIYKYHHHNTYSKYIVYYN